MVFGVWGGVALWWGEKWGGKVGREQEEGQASDSVAWP